MLPYPYVLENGPRSYQNHEHFNDVSTYSDYNVPGSDINDNDCGDGADDLENRKY